MSQSIIDEIVPITSTVLNYYIDKSKLRVDFLNSRDSTYRITYDGIVITGKGLDETLDSLVEVILRVPHYPNIHNYRNFLKNLFEERYVGQFPSMEDLIKHDVKIMSSPTHLWKMGVDTLSNGIIAMEYIYKDYSEFKIEKFAAIYTIRTDYHGNTVVRGVKKDNIPGAQS